MESFRKTLKEDIKVSRKMLICMAFITGILLFVSTESAFAVSKIGIVTGTTSQNEEEYRAAEDMIQKYGADRIIHVTYPDRFMDEQETTIQQIVSLADDPDVKGIVLNQAVPGCVAGVVKAKEFRPDIFTISVQTHEEPHLMSEKNDIVLDYDQAMRGKLSVLPAHNMGAKTLVHYSFPRHMARPQFVERRDLMKAECERLGMEFVFQNAPDPTGDAGLAGTQQFVLEDIPRQVQKYGPDTAFYTTNVGMMEPIIKAAVESKAIVSDACDPSPYLGYPGALGISIPPEKKGDVDYLLDAIQQKINEAGVTGRFGTTRRPGNIYITYAAVDYLFDVIDGKIKGYDRPKMEECMRKYLGENTQIRTYDETTPNILMFAGETVIFDKK
jgi:hypothetical protein